jgi:glutamate dehydrogenase
MRSLEAKGALSRSIEFLPDDKAIAERMQMRRGLTAPEISVLLAYAKITLKESILATALPDAPELQQLLVEYFPVPLVQQCSAQLPSHPLKREIITTQLVNRLVNRMGTTFTMQLGDETGANAAQVAAAWYAASELLGAEAAWREIEALDLKVPAAQQMQLMNALREMVGAATRQIMAAQKTGATIASQIETYRDAVTQAVSTARAGQGDSPINAVLEARACIVAVFELVDLASASGRDLAEIATACARLDASLDMTWLGNAIGRLPAGNRWQARARAQLAGELRKLRQSLLQRNLDETLAPVTEARSVVDELKRNAPQDLAMLSAGLSEIRRLLTA